MLVLVLVIEYIEFQYMHFDHEKLDVYKVSLEFNKFIALIAGRMKGTNRHACDQLVRAGLSIPLNIAEGNGKRSSIDRRRFWEIARGSAMECSAIFDVLIITDVFSEEELSKGKELLYRIVSMLSKMTGEH